MRDRELVYLYRTEGLMSAKDELLKRYGKWMQKRGYKIKNSVYYGLPLEFDDFKSLSYTCIVDTINQFDLRQFRYEFVQALCTINHADVYHEINKNLGNRNMVMNDALSYQCLDIENDARCSYDGEKECIDRLAFDDMRAQVLKFLSVLGNPTERIIKYKMDGFSDNEIARKVRWNVKKVTNCYTNFVKRFRKRYGIITE